MNEKNKSNIKISIFAGFLLWILGNVFGWRISFFMLDFYERYGSFAWFSAEIVIFLSVTLFTYYILKKFEKKQQKTN